MISIQGLARPFACVFGCAFFAVQFIGPLHVALGAQRIGVIQM